MVLIDEGSWQHFREDQRYIARVREDQISYGWDNMIDRVHEGGFADYETIARELARPTRFQRRFLSKSFFDAHLTAHEDKSTSERRRIGPYEGVTYCFLFCEENMSKEEREAMLKVNCYVARGTFQENAKVIGIATEKRIGPMCSYSFCLVDFPRWTSVNQAEVEEIQGKFGILVDPSPTYVEEREYPI